MVRRGAKNLILISRFGPRNETANSFLQELRDQDVHVEVPACDISNFDLLKSVLAELSLKMPLVRGCVQSSMLLRVSKVYMLWGSPC